MAFIYPLDLGKILINTLSGSLNIFIFLAFIFIASMGAMFRMPNLVLGAMFALFGIFLSNYVGGIYAFVIIISGLIIFYAMGRIIKN